MTGMCAHLRSRYGRFSRIDIDKHLIESWARRYQLLLQAIGDQRLDAGTVRGAAIRQRVAHQRQEIAITLVLRTITLAALELLQIGLFRLDEGIHQRTSQPRIALDVLVLHHDETVDRVDAALAKPIGLDLF